MQIPTIHGIIDRRILANFRVTADVLAKVLPHPFKPQLIRSNDTEPSYGIAGICMIRLTKMRLSGMPSFLGMASENAAHRMAVDWKDTNGHVRSGVYVPRRDTSSRITSLVGGRIFPGVAHFANFHVEEADGRYLIEMNSHDQSAHILFEGHKPTLDNFWFPDSIFGSLKDVSDFFEKGSLGYSDTKADGRFDGLELQTDFWKCTPIQMNRFESSFFDDPQKFPVGSISFDNALLMEKIPHSWKGKPCLCG